MIFYFPVITFQKTNRYLKGEIYFRSPPAVGRGYTRLHTSLLGPDHYDVATVTQSFAVERYYTCLILSVREKVCNVCLIKRMHGYILSYVSQSVKK